MPEFFDDDEVRDVALSAISDLLQTIEPGSMVQRFVLLAEIIGADSERSVWMLTPPDAKAWDSLGLLEYAKQVELSATVRGDE
jgi:hypothetical protein